MVGAEIPLPPNPGEPVPSVPPVGQADGTPSATRAWGSQRLIYFVMSFIASEKIKRGLSPFYCS
jgi:hypothetical protein